MQNGTVPTQEAMETAILVDGGFTYSPDTGQFLRPIPGLSAGYVIAIPGTQSVDVTELVEAADYNDFIGGWIDHNGVLILELVEIWEVSREQALLVARARNQEAIFDFATGEVIPTVPVTV